MTKKAINSAFVLACLSSAVMAEFYDETLKNKEINNSINSSQGVFLEVQKAFNPVTVLSLQLNKPNVDMATPDRQQKNMATLARFDLIDDPTSDLSSTILNGTLLEAVNYTSAAMSTVLSTSARLIGCGSVVVGGYTSEILLGATGGGVKIISHLGEPLADWTANKSYEVARSSFDLVKQEVSKIAQKVKHKAFQFMQSLKSKLGLGREAQREVAPVIVNENINFWNLSKGVTGCVGGSAFWFVGKTASTLTQALQGVGGEMFNVAQSRSITTKTNSWASQLWNWDSSGLFH